MHIATPIKQSAAENTATKSMRLREYKIYEEIL